MTTVYFVRHAESDFSVRDDRTRPLTEKGLQDCSLVAEFLQDKGIDAVISSPYKRSLDTVAGFAEKSGYEIEMIEGFRERKPDSVWIEDKDFISFMMRQWADFSYKLSDGECLAEVQDRNISALSDVLARYRDKSIVIGTHGTALSTIISYYDKSYGFVDFMAIVDIVPWVVKMEFDGSGFVRMEMIDIFFQGYEPESEKCEVLTVELGSQKFYRYVVVFSRYKDKWLYCRIKDSDAYGNAGGHIEHGETPLDAAKRELFEETGAVNYDITPIFDYSVYIPNARSCGQVFLAHIHELGDLPDFEIDEVRLFDTIPDKLRFPHILPVLYKRVQAWINLNSARG